MRVRLLAFLVVAGCSFSALAAGERLQASSPAKFGGLTTKPASGPTDAGSLAASLPDLMGTTLGFAVNGFTAWGSTTTIDQPNQVKSTQVGVNKNLCIIGTGLYRTFNKGSVAVGSFVDRVYRNGTLVYTRNVASLAPGTSINFQNHDLSFQEGMNVIQVKMDANNNVFESNESNTFEVRVMVKVDCDGDGVYPGAMPKIKNPSAPTGAKPVRPSIAVPEPTRRGR